MAVSMTEYIDIVKDGERRRHQPNSRRQPHTGPTPKSSALRNKTRNYLESRSIPVTQETSLVRGTSRAFCEVLNLGISSARVLNRSRSGGKQARQGRCCVIVPNASTCTHPSAVLGRHTRFEKSLRKASTSSCDPFLAPRPAKNCIATKARTNSHGIRQR